MSYPLAANGSYGSGAAGAITDPSTVLNAYANVTSYVAGGTITIGTPSTSAYSNFTVGQEILLHVSAQTTGTDGIYLGHFQTAHITGVAGSVLTVDNPIVEGVLMAAASFANYVIQAITVPSFTTLTLTAATVAPTLYSTTNKYGGIVALKCTVGLVLNGGKISLGGLGIPTANKTQRIIDAQETSGSANTDQYSGWENHITSRRMYLNSGDGTAFIQVANFTVTNIASRIGYAAGTGVQFARSATTCAIGAAGLGTGTGGSVILLVAGTITGFVPAIISTQPSAAGGQGLGRCYIASNTKLLNDEGLYAYEVISNAYRLMQNLNISNYCTGSLGVVTNPTTCINSYAKITNISANGLVLTYTNKTTGLAPIAAGAMVMFHVSKQLSTNFTYLGKFMLARVLSDDGTFITLATSVLSLFPPANLASYSCQLVSIPEFSALTINSVYNSTLAWDDVNKIGGICALACSGILNLASGQINVEGKGGGTAYGASGLTFISNNGCSDILPLGQGQGSIFILSQTLTLDNNSRIGASYDGSLKGGYNTAEGSGGIRGIDGFAYPGMNCQWTTGAGGNNAGGGGQAANYYGNAFGYCNNGGYGSNGINNGGGGIRYAQGVQGAHVFIIANTINNFYLSAISTGGATGYLTGNAYANGGAGYGGYGGITGGGYASGDSGGGGYNGGGGGGESAPQANSTYPGGGGSSGWAFIYANTVTSPNSFAGALLGGTT